MVVFQPLYLLNRPRLGLECQKQWRMPLLLSQVLAVIRSEHTFYIVSCHCYSPLGQ